MALELRYYQRESLEKLYQFWRNGGRNGLLVVPTGGGKSLIIATLCKELLAEFPALRIGVIVHVKELIAQNTQELLSMWPQAPVGVYSASIGRRDARAQIVMMGIQSVYNKTDLIGDIDLLIIDEAHLIPRSSETMYGRFIAACDDRNDQFKMVGLTATDYRLDSGRLHEGDEALFDAVVHEIGVRELIEAGFLSKLISKASLSEIDTEGLHRRAGEFVQSEMDERARVPSVVQMAVREIVEAGADRHGWLVFCTSVAHAEDVMKEMRSYDGVTCEIVTGKTPQAERDRIVRRYKAREIRCLASVGVLTTGFNAPHVDLIALLRPTLSTGLYVQMIGRGFRLAPGKENCLVLDFAGNVKRHGPVDAVNPRKGRKGSPKERPEEAETEIRAKACPVCRTLVPVPQIICDCGFEWPPPPTRHEPEAERVAILSTEIADDGWIAVDNVSVRPHFKIGSPTSMLAIFQTEKGAFRQWISFEHAGRAGERAGILWRQLGGLLPIPETVADACRRAPDELRPVVAIKVRKEGRYPEIVSHRLGPRVVGEESNWRDEADYFSDRRMTPALQALDEDIPF